MPTLTKEQFEEMMKERFVQSCKEQNIPTTDAVISLIEEQISAQFEKAKADFIGAQDKDPKEDPKDGFKNFSDFARSIWVAGANPRKIDPRLLKMEEKERQKAAGTSLNEGDAEAGGYLIPTEFRNQLLELAIEKSNILNMAVIVPMASNAVRVPYLSGFDHSGGTVHGGVQWSWLDEEDQKSETRPKFGQIGMRLHKIAGLCYTSDEILEDSPISMEPLLTRLFADSLAWQLDDVFINGTGAGQPQGIMTAPCMVSQAKQVGQAATTIVYENLIKMYAHLWRKQGAVWMANHDTFPALATMTLTVGAGGVPVYLPAGGATGKPYDSLFGLPLMMTEHCQTLGTSGDILLCDWSQYLIGQKAGGGAGVKFDTSIHIKFDFDQTAFRFVFRIDGQPWWPTYMTPQHSTNYLTPFVKLDTR